MPTRAHSDDHQVECGGEHATYYCHDEYGHRVAVYCPDDCVPAAPWVFFFFLSYCWNIAHLDVYRRRVPIGRHLWPGTMRRHRPLTYPIIYILSTCCLVACECVWFDRGCDMISTSQLAGFNSLVRRSISKTMKSRWLKAFNYMIY